MPAATATLPPAKKNTLVKRDPEVKATSTDTAVSGPTILAWAVRGCLDWQSEGLGKTPRK